MRLDSFVRDLFGVRSAPERIRCVRSAGAFSVCFFLISFCALLLLARPSHAEIFQFTDADGKTHFVDSAEKIPEQYRTQNRKAISLPKISRSNPDRKQLYEKSTYENTASGSKRVEVFVADWCGYCSALEKILKEKKIAYQRRDIEKDKRALREYKSLGGGGIPITRIGTQVFRGYAPKRILAALGKK